MKKLKRSKHYEVSVSITDADFIKTPRETQRQWLVQRALGELTEQLDSLHALAPKMVAGGEQHPVDGNLAGGQAVFEGGQLKVNGQAVMEDWQRGLMEMMADTAASRGGDVLEVGFGLGLSATRIQAANVASHTIVECNPNIVRRIEEWKSHYPGRDIRVLVGRWQDVALSFAHYDGILFDTYPLTQEEFFQTVLRDVTYAQHFFETAARHLKPGGIFTYFTGEIDSLSRAHQRLLLRFFSEVSIRVAQGLKPQPDSQIWWMPTMAVVKAIK